MRAFCREFNVAGRRVVVKHKPPSALMGRFGGGWQWEAGFQLGGSTLIVNLLVLSVRVDYRRRRR